MSVDRLIQRRRMPQVSNDKSRHSARDYNFSISKWLYQPESTRYPGSPLWQVKKIFKRIIKLRWSAPKNEEVLKQLDGYIPEYVLACKSFAETEMRYYEQNKQNPAVIAGNTRADQAQRKAYETNGRLLSQANEAERVYQHAKKVLDVWAEVKSQYVPL